MKASVEAAGWKPLVATAQWLVPALVALAMTLSPVKAVARIYVFSDPASLQVNKDLGAWIGKQQTSPIRIMDLSLPLTYHADAQFAYFPYCSGDLALRYIDAMHVDYVVLRKQESFTRYYADWLANGIPDRRAERVQLPSIPGAEDFIVYRWRPASQGGTMPAGS